MRLQVFEGDKTIYIEASHKKDSPIERLKDIALLELKLNQLKEEAIKAYECGIFSMEDYQKIKNKILN